MRTFRLRQFEVRRPVAPLAEGLRVVRPSKTIKGMGGVTKKKLSWDASSSPAVVGYRVYWEVDRHVDYDSTFADVGGVTVLVLPDDIPSFPRVTGQMQIGITSLSRSGNESDMRVLSVFIDFTRPEAPLNVKIEDIEREL